MFGKNPVAPINNKTDGKILRIVRGSPWETIQGEGPYAGYPATFIRLHGCNLRCTFCDTQFSDETDPLIVTHDLAVEVKAYGHKLVVITGGEPFIQNILPLCVELNSEGFLVQIETAGTIWIDGIQNFAKLVVSPKTHAIHPKIKHAASAFKYIISASNEHDGYLPITATQPDARPQVLAAPRSEAVVYLSPMDEYDEVKNTANRRLVATMAMRYDVRAGLQMHKYLMVD